MTNTPQNPNNQQNQNAGQAKPDQQQGGGRKPDQQQQGQNKPGQSGQHGEAQSPGQQKSDQGK